MMAETDRVTPISTVAKAAESGDERELLLALRDRVACAVGDPKCSPRDLAPLSRRLQEISQELRTLDIRIETEAEAASDGDDEAWDGSKI
jgi:hypothetical protein